MGITKRYIKRPIISRRVVPFFSHEFISIKDNSIEEKVQEEAKEEIISIEETQVPQENDSVLVSSNEEEVVEEKKQPKKQRRTKKQKNAEIDENNELKEE